MESLYEKNKARKEWSEIMNGDVSVTVAAVTI